jgi:MSHA biogenesis protein MshJ
MVRLNSWIQWYEQRPLRERVMLLLCLLVVVAFLVNLIVLDPLSDQKRAVRREMITLQSQQVELQARESIVASRKDADPDRVNRQKLDRLVQESKRLHDQLEAGIVNLVAPRDMPALLKDLLTQQKKLQLVKLENLPPRQVALTSGNSNETMGPVLYIHPLRIEFKGDYLTLLKYLRQLENLPKALVWEDVEIETQTYPAATVRIQVYTLSLTEGWIGG